MRNLLRGAIAFAATLAVIALLLAFNDRWPWVNTVSLGLATAFLLIGSIVKLWRVAHGDFSVTSDVFWLPKRVRSWMHPELYEKKQLLHGKGAGNSN